MILPNNLTRAEKIQFLNDIQNGKKRFSSLFKIDLSKLTVDELNSFLRIVRNNEKREMRSIESLSDEEILFLQGIEEALRTRPVNYGLNTKKSFKIDKLK